VPTWQSFTVSATLDAVEGTTYADALGTPLHEYSSSGPCAWLPVATVGHDDASSVQSGIIGDQSTSTLQTYIYGSGSISFWWKVSSERNYDFLRFYIDGVTPSALKAQISGNVDWQYKTFSFDDGQHLVTWQYYKDESSAAGEDAGWVDQVSIEVNYDTANFTLGMAGSVHIDSGTGNFSSVGSSNEIEVMPSTPLVGTVGVTLTSGWDAQLMPVIAMPSWGSVYLWDNVDVAKGTTSLSVNMDGLTAPTVPGNYYLAIAFRPETGAAYVASSTYHALGTAVWGDGNDLNVLNATQLAAALADGRIPVRYLVGDGQYETVYVPCAVIIVHVTDLVPPVTTATVYGTQGSNGWYRSAVSVLLSATDVGSTVAATYYSIDGGATQLYTPSIDISAEGTHTLRYWSVDSAGNIETTHSMLLRIDVTLPIAAIEVRSTAFQGNDGYDLRQPTIVLSSYDAVSGPASIQYRFNEGGWQTYSGQFQYPLTTSATLYVVAIDAAGNEGAVVSTYLKVDASPPVVEPIVTGHQTAAPWYDSAALVTLSVQESGSGVQSVWYSFDGVTFSNYTAPFWVNLTGTYHLWARASDVAGNMGDIATLLLLVDLDLPQADTVIQGSEGLGIWWYGPMNVTLAGTDQGSGLDSIRYILDGANEAIYSHPFSISGEGRHNLTVTVRDIAGNIAVRWQTIGIDTGAPSSTLAFSEQVNGETGWYNRHPRPLINITDAVSGAGAVTLLIDDVQTAYAPLMLLDLEGTHVLRYQVADAAGNLGPWQELTIRVDTIAPATTVDITGPLGLSGWYIGDVNITLMTNETVSGIASLQIRWDGGAWTPSNGSITLSTEGRRMLEIRAVDVAGNVAESAPYSIWLDKSAPAMELTTPGDDHVTTHSAEVRWDGIDGASGIGSVLISVDGGAFVDQGGNAGSYKMENLADGRHTVVVRLVDSAGNSVDLRSTITVDTNPLSPGGPYGPWPILILLGAVALIAAGWIFWRRR
jgi:hypothetical protein